MPNVNIVQDFIEDAVVADILAEYFDGTHEEARYYVFNTYTDEMVKNPVGEPNFSMRDLQIHIKHKATPWEHLMIFNENSEGELDATRPFINGLDLIAELNTPQATGGVVSTSL